MGIGGRDVAGLNLQDILLLNVKPVVIFRWGQVLDLGSIIFGEGKELFWKAWNCRHSCCWKSNKRLLHLIAI